MNRTYLLHPIVRILALIATLCSFARLSLADELILCGWDEVFILKAGPNGISTNKVWSWKAGNDLPEEFRDKFRSTDDCKPVDGGRKILISSSGGGIALVERATGKTLFYAYVGNAHSVELLPNNRIAVAGSRHEQGNCVAIFDLDRPGERIFTAQLDSGHGVVWDDSRQVLWALGYDQLLAFGLKNWDTPKPGLDLQKVYKLPDISGHDLISVPNSDELLLTTARHVFLFNREQRGFRKHPVLGDEAEVKSVTIHPRTGRVVYTQAEAPNWWSSTLHLLNPAAEVRLPGERLYKTRWNPSIASARAAPDRGAFRSGGNPP